MAAGHTDVVVTHLRWYWPDEDLWCYDELDADRWPLRHIERRGNTFIAAASLHETLEAGDSTHERRYGVLPEGQFPITTAPGEPPIEPIPPHEFERLWHQARADLTPPPRLAGAPPPRP